MLELYDRNGQSQVDFAREQGINYNTLVGWLYHRRKGGASGTRRAKQKFQQLSLPQRPRALGGLLLRLPGGIELEIREAESVSAAVQLVRELQRCSD